jgi:hypothetical protein
MMPRADVQAVYPGLAHLIGAYFHEDWMHDAARSEEVVRQFSVDEPKELVRQARSDIDRLLKADSGDAVLDDVLFQLGSCFDPSFESFSSRTWLAHVGKLLSQAG